MSMIRDIEPRAISAAKDLVTRRVREARARGEAVKRAEVMEAVAREAGFTDWNRFLAAHRRPVKPGPFVLIAGHPQASASTWALILLEAFEKEGREALILSQLPRVAWSVNAALWPYVPRVRADLRTLEVLEQAALDAPENAAVLVHSSCVGPDSVETLRKRRPDLALVLALFGEMRERADEFRSTGRIIPQGVQHVKMPGDKGKFFHVAEVDGKMRMALKPCLPLDESTLRGHFQEELMRKRRKTHPEAHGDDIPFSFPSP